MFILLDQKALFLLEDGTIIKDTKTVSETLQELENYFSVQV